MGVFISNNLKVGTQCCKIAKKGNQILGLIGRSFTSRDKYIMLKLNKSLVRLQLDYCVQVWCPFPRKYIDIIEKVQRRATRMIEGFKGLAYEERLRRSGLTTLETRRIRADLSEVFEVFRGIEGLNMDDFG